MPMSTVENALKKYEKQAQNAKPGSLSIMSPSKLTISVELFTDNLNRTRNEVRSIIKKANFKEHKLNLEDFFEEKGIVIAKSKDKDINKAVDDAIEAGAEDVTGRGGDVNDLLIRFVCEPNDFYKVRNEIEKMNYEIDYADVEKIPHVLMPVNEDESERVKLMLSKLDEHEEVVKVYCNFEL
ncbi:putative transcriptional regulatory protein [Armadillidium nasatum]|uniref:Putative transcriptional regulatory protein n=1 Tax=Armadillidium nasatum TaxID=96803 RepID=A0A5N5T1X0_9CRUS|nr:putative transcriptional regulatory protein [Armadillidium nasatum]